MQVYLHSSIRLHGIVLRRARNTSSSWRGTLLSTGTTLPLPEPLTLPSRTVHWVM
jgi:hypothetical protein